MNKSPAIALLITAFLPPAVTLQASSATKIALAAGVTTITVNALEIRTTTAKAVNAWRATRKATIRAAKKVAGKN